MLTHQQNLDGVEQPMIDVCLLAASYLSFNVRVHEGVRLLSRQKVLVDSGASKTLDSRHLTGHAVDLLPCVDIDKDGKLEIEELYSWPMMFVLAGAMRRAALELNVNVTWGGVWDTPLASIDDPETECAKYVLRRKAKYPKKKVFIDGPHYQLDWKTYPADKS